MCLRQSAYPPGVGGRIAGRRAARQGFGLTSSSNAIPPITAMGPLQFGRRMRQRNRSACVAGGAQTSPVRSSLSIARFAFICGNAATSAAIEGSPIATSMSTASVGPVISTPPIRATRILRRRVRRSLAGPHGLPAKFRVFAVMVAPSTPVRGNIAASREQNLRSKLRAESSSFKPADHSDPARFDRVTFSSWRRQCVPWSPRLFHLLMPYAKPECCPDREFVPSGGERHRRD